MLIEPSASSTKRKSTLLLREVARSFIFSVPIELFTVPVLSEPQEYEAAS